MKSNEISIEEFVLSLDPEQQLVLWAMIAEDANKDTPVNIGILFDLLLAIQKSRTTEENISLAEKMRNRFSKGVSALE